MSAQDNTMMRFWRRIQLTIGRGRITAVDDSKSAQLLQIEMGAMETRDKTPRIAEYGFTSSPPLTSEVVVVFIAGDRSTGIAIASNHQPSRPTGLAEGEVMIYDRLGRQIYLTQDDGIIIDAAASDITIKNCETLTINASKQITLNTPLLKVNGNITATGDITDKVRSMAGDRTIYNSHTNTNNGNNPPSQQQ